MDWPKLLSYRRLGKPDPEEYDPARPPWQMDYDRIVFSSAFRRMQDKTQVFPLSGSDYVRTRLTHSLEVSTVARSMGTMAGKVILDRHGHEPYTADGQPLKEVLNPSDIGTITATGALAHDIGNPPFGHSGEDSIRYWFTHSGVAEKMAESMMMAQKLDFVHWEGNAAGFRILSRLQMARNQGGFQLTAASLGAYTKYPTSVMALEKKIPQSAKKPGFFQQDAGLWQTVADELGLVKEPGHERWCRHPLAYLTEAADDICYRMIDLEDGFRLGRVSYAQISELFMAVAGAEASKIDKIPADDEIERVTYLRALAISAVVRQVVRVFVDHEAAFLSGKFEGDILKHLPSQPILKAMLELARKQVYSAPSVIQIEAAGYDIIFGLLEIFAFSVEQLAANSDLPESQQQNCSRSKKILQLMPSSFLAANRKPDPDPYARLLGVMDFVAGMTDTFALTMHRRITGVSLPS